MRPPRAPNRRTWGGTRDITNLCFWFVFSIILTLGGCEGPASRDDGPALLVKPDSSIVPADTRVSFFCRADGNPIPTVVWRRNGEPISDSRFTTKTLTNGLSTLRIDPVELSDNNLTISCTADNGVGSPIKAEAILTVLSHETVPSGFPEIEAHPVLKSVEQGRTAYVTCRVKGNPRPRVLWLRDLMPIDIRSNNRYSVSTLGNPGALMIQQAREDDQGKYECVARNEHGVIHSKPAHIYVKVRRVPPYFTVKLQKVYRVGIGASINLTCVAVGYPMPRVFWKRKSDDYFLNDPETAPFGKNVLTLTNVDHTDNYTCIAVSKLGNIEVSTTVEGKPLLPAPTGVKVVDSKECTVRIRWDPVSEVSTEDPLQSYIIKYRQKYAERGGVFKEQKIPPSQTSAIIEGLEPYTQYEFILLGVSALGRGQAALPVESQTAESLPVSPPAEVKARPLNSQAVLVQWAPPNNPNGRIIGYEVFFTNKPLSDEADKTGWQKKDFKSDELMATLSGLDPEKTYYIQIRARNAKGVGPFSKTVTVITKQGVPGQPSKLTAKAVDARRIALTWEKPLHSFNIVSYTIRFNVSKTETKELLLTSNVQKHTVDGLRPTTTYTFRVAAHSDRGQGVFCDGISATTMPIAADASQRPVPSAPRDLEVVQVNASTVKLTWDRPESENGELLGYYVFKEKLLNGEPVDDHIHHEFVIADPAKLYAYVAGLEPNTEYAFRVCAFNPHGDGERTPPKKMMTGGMPPSPPRPQSVSMLSDDAPLRARIDWLPPEMTYGQPVNAYSVYYRPVDKLGIQDGFERLEVSGTQQFAELTKLLMGREYEIHLSAGSDDGWSANATERLITPVGVPDGEPLNVRYDIVSGQMTLQWDPPAPDRRNGNITYYRAILTPLDGSSKRIDRNITTGRSSTYRVSAKHGYTFKVAAATMKGEGPFSPVLNVSPYDSALVGSPSNVRVQATSNSSAVIQWDFDDSNGGSDGFIVKYLHEPVLGEHGRDDTAHWRSQTVMDPKARHLEIVRLNAHKPYAFCVLALKQSRLGQCSDPPITVDKLQPIHMVQNLHVQYKTSQSVALKWDYSGPQPIRFFVKQSGQKSYLNQDLVEKRLVAPGFENKVDGAERSFMWQNLRQYMDYTFQVGVVSLHDGTVFWPKEVKVRTDATGPPFVEPPVFIEARTLGTAQIQLRCASEEYGPISHYWIIVVPGNYSKDDVRIMDSVALERSTAALKPKLTIAPVAKKVKKAADDEDDSDSEEVEKVKRALDFEANEADDYVETESEISRIDDDSGIEADALEPVQMTKMKSKKQRQSKRYVDKRSGNSLDGIYIAAKIEAQEMRQLVRDQRSFTLGDGNNYHGFLNHPLDADAEYGVMMRAFAKGESATRRNDRPFEYRPPMQEPAAKLYTDSPLSNPFSTKASDGVGKGKATSMWLLGPFVIVLVVIIILGMLICWRFRSSKKGTRNNRHGSIMKVALPSGGPFMNGVSESSKLLTDAYGRPINGYGDANGNASHLMESSMVDMYPGIGNGQTIMGSQSNYPSVQLPLPINGSMPTQTNTVARGPIPINELATHIDKLKMNNNMLFTQEFECIDGGQHFTWESSSLDINKPKNRYANVVAYDHSRVLLDPIDNVPGSDYVNANYIDGYGRARAYIATQGPLPETFGDFWRMVWEQNSSVIVMLTRLEERARVKCDQYWPTKGSAVYDRVAVTLMDTVELAHYTIRTLQLEHLDDKEMREVKQLQYTAWPDHGVPDHPTPFLMFLKRVKALNSPESGPIISHCSAGIGRTGAFIAIDYMLDKLRRENLVDIFECVTTLRAQRSYMVQTDDQYIFIHDAVLDAAQSGSTEVPAAKLYHHMQRLLQAQELDQYNGLELEFMTLSTLKTLNSRCMTANLPVNRPKNRYPHVVPYDTTRVILNPYANLEGSDYINASWVDGYRQRANYIATQGPMNGTVNDFWRMLWEKESCIVVMITRLREMSREKCFEYWPIDQPVSFDDLVVEPIAEYNMPQYVLREFKVADRQTGRTRTVRHFQFIEWPENGVPKSAEMFIEFIRQIHHTKVQFGVSGPITVHCSTGAGRTGVFIALATIMDRMTLEHVVDVFTTVKLLRTERQNMVEEKDEYQFVYQAALEYLATYDQSYE